MKRIYKALLRLYPADCRAWCAPEMLETFESAAEDHELQGRVVFGNFILAELVGLARGVSGAWVAKLTSSRYMRGFWAPTKMRPPGKTWEEWYPAGARVLSEVIESQRHKI